MRTALLVVSMTSLSGLGCSSSSNAPPRDGAVEGPRSDSDGSDGDAGDVPASAGDAGGPDAACNAPRAQAATLVGDGFAQWEGLSVLGCFNASDAAADTACDDSIVTTGAFTIMASVCNGESWDVYVFDGTRGLNCHTARPPVDRVFTLTPADCTCASPNRDALAGCEEEADGGADGDAAPASADGASDGRSG